MGKILDRRTRYGGSRPDTRAKIEEAFRHPWMCLLDIYSHGGDVFSVSGEQVADVWDTTRDGGIWVPDQACEEHIRFTAIRSMLPSGTNVEYRTQLNPDGSCIRRKCKPGEASYFWDTQGNPTGEVPDERYVNLITYVLPDGQARGGYKNFVTAIRAAAKALGVKIDPKQFKDYCRKEALICARQAVEVFNDWCAGRCYGVVVEVMSPIGDTIDDEEDSCWGYVGEENAEESLKDTVEAKVKHLTE